MNEPDVRPARWVMVWSGLLLAAEIAVLAWVGLRQTGQLGTPWPISVDFLSFYAAGQLVLAGTPSLVYDQTVHMAVEHAISANGGPYVFFLYPPVFLLPCAVLALLPYPVAYAVFIGATACLFLVMLRGVIGGRSLAWIVPALAFPAAAWTVFMGQNAFLNAALLGYGLSLRDRRPVLAGVSLGALCYKPHVAMLVPVWLAATGRWRVMLVGALTAATLGVVSVLILGPATWQGYIAAAAQSDAVYTTGRINLVAFPTVLAALLLLGVPLSWAYAAQAAVIVGMVALVWVVFRLPARPAAALALLVAATLLAMPVLSFNDQILAVIAVAYLKRDAADQPWSRLEIGLLAGACPAAIVAPVVAALTHFPLGLTIDLVILGLCARRCFMRGTGGEQGAIA